MLHKDMSHYWQMEYDLTFDFCAMIPAVASLTDNFFVYPWNWLLTVSHLQTVFLTQLEDETTRLRGHDVITVCGGKLELSVLFQVCICIIIAFSAAVNCLLYLTVDVNIFISKRWSFVSARQCQDSSYQGLTNDGYH